MFNIAIIFYSVIRTLYCLRSYKMKEKAVLNLEDQYVLWDRTTVERVLGIKTTALYRAINEEGLPKPIRVGARRSMWRKSDVLAWIDSRPQELSY